MGESGSEVSHFIPGPRNFAEVTKLSENIRKPWLKATLKEINNLINNKNFLMSIKKNMNQSLHAWMFIKQKSNQMEALISSS